MPIDLQQSDREIIAVLKQRPRSLPQLAAKLGLPLDEVEQRCQRLAAEGLLAIEESDALDRKIRDGLAAGPSTVEELGRRVGASAAEVARRCALMRFYGELSSTELGELDARIFDALEGKGPVTTSKVAERIGQDRSRVYRRCLRLGEAFLGSERAKADRPLYFFPVTGDILTGASYPHVGKVMHDLRTIVDRHPIPRGAEISPRLKAELYREYRGYLGRLATAAPPGEAAQVRAFEGELMRVLSGTTKRDVVALFGVRQFWPQVRAWRLEVVANPSWREHWVIGKLYWFLPATAEPGHRRPIRRLSIPAGAKPGDWAEVDPNAAAGRGADDESRPRRGRDSRPSGRGPRSARTADAR